MDKHAVPDRIKADGHIAKYRTKQSSYQNFRSLFTNMEQCGNYSLNQDDGYNFARLRLAAEIAELQVAAVKGFVAKKIKEIL